MSQQYKKQTRREFLKSNLAGAIGIATVPALAESYSHKTNALNSKRLHPNIMFIMCDQLNAQALSCYGGAVDTPNINRIANEGVRFNQAACTAPSCSPSRASIVTGMYPHSHGIVQNCSITGKKRNPVHLDMVMEGLNTEDITTEKVLYESGYATHHYGKWHLDGDDLPYYRDMYRIGQEYAMEMSDVFWRTRAADKNIWMNWYNWSLPVEIAPPLKKAVTALGSRWDNKIYADFIRKMGKLKLPHEQNYEVQVCDRTVERIKKTDKPFMITCSFNGPHDPNVVHSPYYDMFDPKKIKLLPNGNFREKRFENNWGRKVVVDLGEDCLREFMRIYYGIVKMIDDQVGRILKALENAGKLDNTIIIFTADHGDMMSGHGMIWKSTSACYDEIVKVPLLIRYPKVFKPQISELATDGTDFMPTILDLVGLPIPSQVQGQSLVPYLTGQVDLSKARAFTFNERIKLKERGIPKRKMAKAKGSFMTRGKGWKYILYPNSEEYMYNLVEDPGETRNVVHDVRYRSVRNEMSTELRKWLQRTGWDFG